MSIAVLFGVLMDDAETDWPGRNQLMLALSDSVPVVLLERSRGHRPLVDWRRPRLRAIAPNLFVVQDALSMRSSPVGRRAARLGAAAIDGGWLRSELRSHGIADYRLWLTVADPGLARGTPAKSLIYDCMDPNFLPWRQERFDRDELGLARRAHIVFASARSLYDRMAQVNPLTYLLPNAAPRPAQLALRAELPRELCGRSNQIVGYLGTVDWRFSARPVVAAAQALPEVTFAIVGRVNDDQSTRVAPLRRLPNVVFCGQVSAAVGNACLAAFSVGMIPFEVSETNDAINPVKMWMYLAAGLPVVTTRLAECRQVPGVAVAEDDLEFVAGIVNALADGPRGAASRIAYAARNTWDERAHSALGIMRANGLL